MAKNRSEYSKYRSLSTGDYCTAAQYLTELLLLREFKKKNDTPVYKFWNEEPWTGKFKRNIILISKLMNRFSEEAVINTFKNKYWWAYSPYLKNISDEIQKEQDIIDSRQKQDMEISHTEKSKPMKSNKKSKRARLGDI